MNGRRQMGPITRPAELASWVMMGNRQKGKSTLLVEGTTDSYAWASFTDAQLCRIIVAEGKDNVLKAMEIIRRSGYVGAFAVVDADFDHLTEPVPAPFDDVALTDTHDFETMMLGSIAFHKVLLRHGYWTPGIEVKTEEFEQSAAQLLRRLLNTGLRLGYLRWASHINNLNIRVGDIELAKVVDPSTLLIREDRFEEAVLRASKAAAGSWAEIKSRADALADDKHDPLQICNGHDLTTLLAMHLGRKTGANVTRRAVEADLSLAYSIDDFRRTAVFASIAAWEQRHGPRRILR